MKIIELDNRLRLIAALAAGGGRVADVGTDHGYIPVYLAQTGLAERITASDVNPGPLQAARRSAERYGVADRIGFVLSDGLENVPRDVDTVIVAGMGGETIQGILERADWLREKDARLILQPQSKLPELTSWLRENGYALTDAALAREGDRYYPVLTVRPGEGGAEDAEALLLEKREPL
ncbi:MAG: SAM-dependent methyltransferase, partial [Oscillospiraceae bacterium]|nr:SAM-dependent methyltransferase [Oscillospiraceae bacterium]